MLTDCRRVAGLRRLQSAVAGCGDRVRSVRQYRAGLSPALVAFVSRVTDPRCTATQYVLFFSLAAVPRTFANGSAGHIVAETGGLLFFFVCFALTLPCRRLLPKIAPWSRKWGVLLPGSCQPLSRQS